MARFGRRDCERKYDLRSWALGPPARASTPDSNLSTFSRGRDIVDALAAGGTDGGPITPGTPSLGRGFFADPPAGCGSEPGWIGAGQGPRSRGTTVGEARFVAKRKRNGSCKGQPLVGKRARGNFVYHRALAGEAGVGEGGGGHGEEEIESRGTRARRVTAMLAAERLKGNEAAGTADVFEGRAEARLRAALAAGVRNESEELGDKFFCAKQTGQKSAQKQALQRAAHGEMGGREAGSVRGRQGNAKERIGQEVSTDSRDSNQPMARADGEQEVGRMAASGGAGAPASPRTPKAATRRRPSVKRSRQRSRVRPSRTGGCGVGSGGGRGLVIGGKRPRLGVATHGSASKWGGMVAAGTAVRRPRRLQARLASERLKGNPDAGTVDFFSPKSEDLIRRLFGDVESWEGRAYCGKECETEAEGGCLGDELELGLWDGRAKCEDSEMFVEGPDRAGPREEVRRVEGEPGRDLESVGALLGVGKGSGVEGRAQGTSDPEGEAGESVGCGVAPFEARETGVGECDVGTGLGGEGRVVEKRSRPRRGKRPAALAACLFGDWGIIPPRVAATKAAQRVTQMFEMQRSQRQRR